MPTLNIDGDARDALREIKRLQDKLEKQERTLGKINMQLRRAKTGMRGAFGPTSLSYVKRMIAQFAGALGLTAAIASAVRMLNEYQEKLKAIARMSRTEADQMRSFYSILPATPRGRRFGNNLIAMGAAAGLKPGATAVLAEPIVSKLNVGDINVITPQERRQIINAFRGALKGAFIGIESELAGTVEVFGASRGLAPGAATGKVLVAAGRSAYSKSDFGRLVPSTAGFKTLGEGLATGVAISGTYAAPEAPTLLRAAGRILGPEGDFHPFIISRGLAGKSTMQKLTALRREALQKGDQSLPPDQRVQEYVARYGAEGLDTRVARGIGAAVVNFGSFKGTLGALQKTDGAQYTNRLYSQLMAAPGQQDAFNAAVAEAQSAASTIFGPTAHTASRRQRSLIAQGQFGISQGHVFGIDPTTGMAKTYGGATIEEWKRLGKLSMLMGSGLSMEEIQENIKKMGPMPTIQSGFGAAQNTIMEDINNRFRQETQINYPKRRKDAGYGLIDNTGPGSGEAQLQSRTVPTEWQRDLRANTEALRENNRLMQPQAAAPARNAGEE